VTKSVTAYSQQEAVQFYNNRNRQEKTDPNWGQ